MRKQATALFLAVCMVLTPLPVQALAADVPAVEETAPVEDVPPMEDETPVEDETPMEDEVPAEDETPVGDVPPAENEDPGAALTEEAATSGSCGANVTWSLVDGTLTISGTGEMADYIYGSAVPWSDRELLSSIRTVIIEQGVTSIGKCAFTNCTSLAGVTIPNGVKTIGQSAFSNCSSLTGVTIPASVTSIGASAFNYCTSLTGVAIPDSVTSLGTSAFSDCTGLTSAVIGNGVAAIEQYTFDGCTGLTKVTIGSGVTSIGASAFYDCTSLAGVTIPNSVKTIGRSAFYNCTSLASVTIPNSVKTIGQNAFYNCASLTSAVLPSGITRIEYQLFCCCTKLTSVTIPNSVTSIGECAFEKCGSLATVTIPDSVTSIGTSAFQDCTSLSSVSISNQLTGLAGQMFMNCTSLASVVIPGSVTSISYRVFENCSSLASVTIPNSVKTIGENMFNGCTSLTGITIPGSVNRIESSAFFGCTGLTDLTIPSGVISIGSNAFNGCTGLTSMTIPGGVTSIGQRAFYGCTGLTGMTIPSGVTEIEYELFSGCTSLTSITLPSGVISIGSDAFNGCTGLTSMPLPSGVARIGSRAFNGCTGLTGMTIPSGVTQIEYELFSGCTSLTSVVIPDTVTSLGSVPFKGCTQLTDIYFGGSKTTWNNMARYGTGAPENVRVYFNSLGPDENIVWYEAPDKSGYLYLDKRTGTIINCDPNTCIDHIPGEIGGVAVEAIGDQAFEGCAKLTDIMIPDSVSAIGGSAFKDCGSLEIVTIPDSVTTLDSTAFEGCSKLTDIYFGGTEEAWNAFPGSGNVGVAGQTTIHYESSGPKGDNIILFELPGGGNLEFDKRTGTIIGCDKDTILASVPSEIDGVAVVSIGSRAFKDCSSLTMVNLPATVKRIGPYAFSGCSELWRIGIPETVTRISQDAFQGCGKLSNVEYGGTKEKWKAILIEGGNEALRSESLLVNTWKYFSFANLFECFFEEGEKQEHYINDYDTEALKKNGLLTYLFKSDSFANWNGSCFGIAAVEGMVNNGFTYTFSNLPDERCPRDDHLTRSRIEYYWCSQFLPSVSGVSSWLLNVFTAKKIGSTGGTEELKKLKENVLNGTPCMITCFYEDYGHTFIVEGGRTVTDKNGAECYELIGRDNDYHGLRDTKTGFIYTTTVKISQDYSSCEVIAPSAELEGWGKWGRQDPLTTGPEPKLKEVKKIIVYNDFQIFVDISPEKIDRTARLFDEGEPQTDTSLFYCLPEKTSAESLVLKDSNENTMTEDNGVQYIRYINQGSTLKEVTDADGNTHIEIDSKPFGLMMELKSDSTAYTASNFDGRCVCIGPDWAAAVSVEEESNASAQIDLKNNSVTLINNTGEFSITVAAPESADTFATVSGSTDTAGETITVTAATNGDVTVDAPAGNYDVIFEDEYGDEYATTATVTGEAKTVTVENPATPIPCSAGYTAGITWNGTAYTVALTGNGASNLTAWQACYDGQGKMLSAAALTGTADNGGMRFSGKAAPEGTCYLFIVDGNNAPVIRKYNLTKHAGGK